MVLNFAVNFILLVIWIVQDIQFGPVHYVSSSISVQSSKCNFIKSLKFCRLDMNEKHCEINHIINQLVIGSFGDLC